MNTLRHKTHCKSRTLHNLSAAAEASTLPGGEPIVLGEIGSAASVQRALSVVINAVAAGTLDAARARVLLSGLRIAAQNARHIDTTSNAEKPASAAAKTADSEAATAPTAEAFTPHEPQLDPNTNATNNLNSAEADTVSSAPPVPSPVVLEQPGQVRIPPSHFSPANAYTNGMWERMRAARERSQCALQRREIAGAALSPVRTVGNRRSFDSASDEGAVRGSAQDDNSICHSKTSTCATIQPDVG